MQERIQKILARAGFGSRRACEDLITAGRVAVNGQRAILGGKADPLHDRINVDGAPVDAPEPLTYIAIYKPRNVLSAAETPDNTRQTVVDLVDLPVRLYPVGRLDVDSEGLILLTNDGDLTNRLTHPRYGHEKEYRVLVAHRPDDEQLATWRRGVVLEDGYRTAPAHVHVIEPSGKGAWLRVVLTEGRKRQIRETGLQIGLPVVRIVRVRIGTLELGSLKPRQWRHLTPGEIAALKGKPSKPAAKSAPKPHPAPAPRTSSRPPGGSRTGTPGSTRSGPPRSPRRSPYSNSRAGQPASRPPGRARAPAPARNNPHPRAFLQNPASGVSLIRLPAARASPCPGAPTRYPHVTPITTECDKCH